MQGKEKVLVVDDEEEIVNLMSRLLKSADYEPITARNGRKALETCRGEKPDLMVLDVKMPEKDGWEVLEELRLDPELLDIPVIMLTALDSSDEVVKGFNRGADDYITKPFDYQVVKARIEAVLRRTRTEKNDSEETAGDNSPRIEVGPLTIDDDKKEVRVRGEKKSLSRKEYELLHLLASKPGRTLSSEKIIEKLWSEESLVNASDVRQFIYLLRRKIEQDPSEPEIVITERGFGYRIADPKATDE